MYISHKYKFVFLRSPKTASSSLSEFFINNIPDPNAVYTAVEDSKIKGQHTKVIENKYRKNFKFYHMTLQELVDEHYLTREQANSYRIISVIRDPADRQKSFYYFFRRWKGKGKPASLEQYKAFAPNGWFEGEPNSKILQSSLGVLDGVQLGEYWLYENLETHLTNFMKDMNVEILYPLPNHKSDFRKNRNNEIQFDTESMMKLLNNFEEDFKLYHELKDKTYESI